MSVCVLLLFDCLFVCLFVCLLVCLLLFFLGGKASFRSKALITSLFCTRKMADACRVCCIKRHQAVESPSHVHRSSVN